LTVVGLGVAWLATSTPASAVTPTVTAATAIAAIVPGADENQYIGSKKCKLCHKKNYDSWAETPHAETLSILKPGQRAEDKVKYNLDPEKDYTTDETCLACHVVGFGKKGGYEVLADEKQAGKIAKSHGHVGCENCHGAGEAYAKLHKAIKKDKRTYAWSEMEEAGMTKATAETCTGCHNDTGPTYDESKQFDFEAMKEKGVHEQFGLKQRED
jgi:hypothetical protein